METAGEATALPAAALLLLASAHLRRL